MDDSGIYALWCLAWAIVGVMVVPFTLVVTGGIVLAIPTYAVCGIRTLVTKPVHTRPSAWGFVWRDFRRDPIISIAATAAMVLWYGAIYCVLLGASYMGIASWAEIIRHF
jgi:hypothetical protein